MESNYIYIYMIINSKQIDLPQDFKVSLIFENQCNSPC